MPFFTPIAINFPRSLGFHSTFTSLSASHHRLSFSPSTSPLPPFRISQLPLFWRADGGLFWCQLRTQTKRHDPFTRSFAFPTSLRPTVSERPHSLCDRTIIAHASLIPPHYNHHDISCGYFYARVSFQHVPDHVRIGLFRVKMERFEHKTYIVSEKSPKYKNLEFSTVVNRAAIPC